MNHFPNELLLYIFSIIVDDSMGNSSPIVILSHVCARWRHLSISTGPLWAKIEVSFPLSEREHKQTSVFLQRASPHPVDILVDVRDPDWDWNEETHVITWQTTVPIVRLLLTQIHRWRRFEMLADNWAPIFTFLFYTKSISEAPLLETVSLSRCNAYLASRGQTFQPVALRRSLPLLGGSMSDITNLKTVILIGVHVEWDSTILKGLTELQLKYHSSDVMPTTPQFREILEACPKLLSLTISGWGPLLDESSKDLGPIFHLPSLKQFNFGFVDVQYAVNLLGLFFMPSLESLSLEDVNGLVDPMHLQDSSALLNWLVIQCEAGYNHIPLRNLITLTMVSQMAGSSPYVRLFENLSLLERIAIRNSNETVLRSLNSTSSITGACVCPGLRELLCQGMSPETLLQVIEGRVRDKSARTLERAVIEEVSKGYSIHFDTMTRLTRAGISIVVGDSEDTAIVPPTTQQ